MTSKPKSIKLASLALTLSMTLGLSIPAHAELILSGTPSAQDRTELNKSYEALAVQLTQVLGEPVRYVPPVNTQGYAQELRKGSYDILIDGPHLGAWRIAKGLHKPVAQADTALTFLVVAQVSNDSIQSLEQLVGKSVCTPPAPQISTLMYLNQYPNPLQIPIVRTTEGDQPQIDKLLNGQCQAAVVSAAFYENKLSKQEKDKLRVIFNTRPLPGFVMTASDKLSAEKREALSKRLSTANPAKDPLVQALTKASVSSGDPEKMRWLSVKTDSIKGLENILIEQSYGWQ